MGLFLTDCVKDDDGIWYCLDYNGNVVRVMMDNIDVDACPQCVIKELLRLKLSKEKNNGSNT